MTTNKPLGYEVKIGGDCIFTAASMKVEITLTSCENLGVKPEVPFEERWLAELREILQDEQND